MHIYIYIKEEIFPIETGDITVYISNINVVYVKSITCY